MEREAKAVDVDYKDLTIFIAFLLSIFNYFSDYTLLYAQSIQSVSPDSLNNRKLKLKN